MRDIPAAAAALGPGQVRTGWYSPLPPPPPGGDIAAVLFCCCGQHGMCAFLVAGQCLWHLLVSAAVDHSCSVSGCASGMLTYACNPCRHLLGVSMQPRIRFNTQAHVCSCCTQYVSPQASFCPVLFVAAFTGTTQWPWLGADFSVPCTGAGCVCDRHPQPA
jgi:hypothetical protein